MGYTLKNSGVIRKYRAASLKEASLKFIRERCQGLGFDNDITMKEKKENIYYGTGAQKKQIPYNMEKDIDRLCLERALERFLKSGRKEDAFDVYFCYLEMFVGDYEKTRRMIELLSEYEANGSGLLMKHRDHYSHSVYVFALGLAIYENSSEYRTAYGKYYKDKVSDERKVACHFLKYWGLSSLFHDIGYPFELPFEQVSSYFEVNSEDRSNNPYVAFCNLDSFTKLDKSIQRKVGKMYGLGAEHSLRTTDELFAYDLEKKLGSTYYFSKEEMLECLQKKPTQPDKFGYFMDHAYFSATVLFKKLFCELKCDFDKEHIDALTAIILHNSLYKFSVAYYKKPECNIPFRVELHPLAYMLMLCDELQCWDRTAYGRNSKLEFHPMHCSFDFSEDNVIKARYIFDQEDQKKIDDFVSEYDEWYTNKKGKEPKLKAYSSIYIKEKITRTDGTCEEVSRFQADIEHIVDLSSIKLNVTHSVQKKKKGNGYLSDSNFINLYNFAVALNGRWSSKELTEEEMYQSFKELSLEYKLSNINQAKGFARYLNEIGAFYTNKYVDYDILSSFTSEELQTIGPLEHARWLQEHYDMGWEYISQDELADIVKNETGVDDVSSAEFKSKLKQTRENLRRHPCLIPDYDLSQSDVTMEQVKSNYERIGQDEQDKDTKPMKLMLDMLKKFEGLRIYRLK